jgi:predicted dehydrogenase
MRVIAIHDVDDIQHWFDSPKRAEFFQARGMKATPFRERAGASSSVAVLIETPDMETLEKALAEPAAADAEKHDGVHVDTIRILLAE